MSGKRIEIYHISPEARRRHNPLSSGTTETEQSWLFRVLPIANWLPDPAASTVRADLIAALRSPVSSCPKVWHMPVSQGCRLRLLYSAAAEPGQLDATLPIADSFIQDSRLDRLRV
jgi:hypothetical protein